MAQIVIRWSYSREISDYDKATNWSFIPSKDSEQPGHLPSLIRDFTVCTKNAMALSYPLSAQGRLNRLGGRLGGSEF